MSCRPPGRGCGHRLLRAFCRWAPSRRTGRFCRLGRQLSANSCRICVRLAGLHAVDSKGEARFWSLETECLATLKLSDNVPGCLSAESSSRQRRPREPSPPGLQHPSHCPAKAVAGPSLPSAYRTKGFLLTSLRNQRRIPMFYRMNDIRHYRQRCQEAGLVG